jgi:UDP-N-acetylglucosamine 2-epimerase (non-hydrolysing)
MVIEATQAGNEVDMVKKILVVFGTRPEAIKMAPVVNVLRDDSDLEVCVCVSGQHRQMLDQVLDIFSLEPDMDLDLMTPGQDLFDVTSRLLVLMRDVLAKTAPDLVLVHGDTTTAFTTALAAFYAGVPVGHVEAGLRSHDIHAPFPEEMNRKSISSMTDLHFAPTELNRQNLLAEGVSDSKIFVTGNTVIDALRMVLSEDIGNQSNDISGRKFDFEKAKYVLITGHRRENFGDGFLAICQAIADLAVAHTDYDFVYPVHLNPNVQKPVLDILAGVPNVHLLPPLPYTEFCLAMHHSTLLLTDSGGIQEEGPYLNKPVVVMRDITERPEAVMSGAAVLVGTNREKIVSTVTDLLTSNKLYDEMAAVPSPFGDGYAARRIHAAITSQCDS